MMAPIELRIVEAVARCRRDGLEPRSIYLNPDDFAELQQLGPLDQAGGLPIKRAARKSTICCRYGITRAIAPKRHLTRRAPLRRRRKPPCNPQ
jgi:hypothetical protein